VTLRSIDEASDDAAAAVKQLRKWGFKLVREEMTPDSPERRLEDATAVACSILGLELSAENRSTQAVVTLARAIHQNCVG
jgi:hypothetical protein